MAEIKDIISCQCKVGIAKPKDKIIIKDQFEFRNCICQTQKEGIKRESYPLLIVRI
ncbi:MAG: hypothetical protein AABY22_11425 [Nanoarchaeota archaeon]